MSNLFFKLGVQSDDSRRKLDSVTSSFDKLSRTTKSTSGDFAKFYDTTKKVNKSFSNINKDANRTDATLKGLTKTFGSLNMAMSATKFFFLLRGAEQFITSAMQMVETNNLFAVSMGTAVQTSEDYINKLNELTGLDPTNLKSFAGTFALLSRSMGINNSNAEVLSRNMVKLGLDLSSLTNVPIAQVMGDLRSGLIGQSETVYKYGIDVTEATLKQEAMNQGITKSVRNMSQGEKMALRYAIMLRQSTLAQGDFARTLETPANQSRVLQERIVTLTRTIGTIFLPALAAVLPYVNAFVNLMIKAAQTVAAFFGYRPEDNSGLANIGKTADANGDALEEMGKKAKNALMGFDELNLISPPSAGGGEGVSVGDPNNMQFADYDNLLDSIVTRTDELEAKMKAKIGDIVTALQPLTNALRPLGETLGEGLQFLYDNVLVPFGQWASETLAPTLIDTLASAFELLGDIIDVVKPSLEWVFDNFLEPIGELGLDTVILALEKLGDAFDSLGKFINENNEFFENFFLLANYILVPLLAFVAGMGLAWGVVKVGGIVLAAILSPIGLVIAGIIALIAAGAWLMTNWDEIKIFVANVWDNMKQKFKDTVDSITKFISNFITGAVLAWVIFKNKLEDIARSIKVAVITKFEEVRDGVRNVILIIQSTVANIFTQIKVTISNIVTTIKDKIVTGFENAVELVKTAFTNFKQGLSIIWDGITDIVSGAVDKIKEIIGGIIDAVSNALSFIGNLANVEVPTVSVETKDGKMKTSNTPRIPKLARGGMLEGGSLFQAGEFGKAEMIGNFNGQTTVMPLEDSGFVSAIREAVYDAVVSGSGGQNYNVVISQSEITSKVIKGSNDKYKLLGRGELTV